MAFEDETPDEWLRIDQVANVANCSRSQVYKLVKKGVLPPLIKLGPKMTRMSRNQMQKCMIAARISQ